jgi:uncharacterized membrane protein
MIITAIHICILQVTKLKLEQKQKEGIAEARSGRRGPVSSWELPAV